MIRITDDGPPLKFVALWGLFALAMLFVQAQMIGHGVKIALPFQTEASGQPTLMAWLD